MRKRRTRRSIKLLLKVDSHLCTLQASFTRMNLRPVVETNEEDDVVARSASTNNENIKIRLRSEKKPSNQADFKSRLIFVLCCSRFTP